MSTWMQVGLGLIIALILGTIACFVILSINRRRGTSPSTSTSLPADEHNTPCNNNGSWWSKFLTGVFGIIGILIALVILAYLCLGLRGCYRWLNPPPPPPPTTQELSARTHQEAIARGEEPLRFCTTPCTIYVGPGQHPKWTEQHPINIKFAGMDWIHVPAIGKEQFVFSEKYDMSKFKPGDAQFASPEDLHLLIQIYAH